MYYDGKYYLVSNCDKQKNVYNNFIIKLILLI